jgi:hypothetical protein
LFNYQVDSIFVQINQEMFDAMIKETSLWPGKETGGMLFGKISEIDLGYEITILKTNIPTEEYCTRKSAYFEISPDYAKKIVEKEKLSYLGNWHRHLGYGGPSPGDLRQIEEYFDINPHLKSVITFILDFPTDEDYDLIIEFYSRIRNHFDQKEKTFETYRIPQSNITFLEEHKQLSETNKGISEEQIRTIKKALVDINDLTLSIEDIDDFEGQTPNEKIISFPFQFKIETSGRFINIDLLILISFPPNFPEGKIFIDISSQDMSKNITFEKYPADMLNDNELIHPFLLSLKASLEEDVPSLLKQPLWKVMQASK